MKLIRQEEKYSIFMNGICLQPPIDASLQDISESKIEIRPGVPGFLLNWYVFSDGEQEIWWAKDDLITNISHKECEVLIGKYTIDKEELRVSLPSWEMLDALPDVTVPYCHILNGPNVSSAWRPVITILPNEGDTDNDPISQEIILMIALEYGKLASICGCHNDPFTERCQLNKLLRHWGKEFIVTHPDIDISSPELKAELKVFVGYRFLVREGYSSIYRSYIPGTNLVMPEELLRDYFDRLDDKSPFYGTTSQRFCWVCNEIKELWDRNLFDEDKVDEMQEWLDNQMDQHFFSMWLDYNKNLGYLKLMSDDFFGDEEAAMPTT